MQLDGSLPYSKETATEPSLLWARQIKFTPYSFKLQLNIFSHLQLCHVSGLFLSGHIKYY
jgi:hypothetical protein